MTTNYLRSAPQELKTLNETRKSAGYGTDALERLLTDPRMNRAWMELGKRIRDNNGWHSLLISIDYAGDEVEYHTKLSRSAERKQFHKLAEKARVLAQSVDSVWPGLSVKVVTDNKGSPFENLSSSTNGSIHDFTLADLIRSLASEADSYSENAMRDTRLVQRKHRRGAKDWKIRVYVRALGKELVLKFGQPLYGTVAAITSVMLPHVDIDKSYVEKVMRGLKKGPL